MDTIKIIVLRKKLFLIEQCCGHNKNIATAKKKVKLNFHLIKGNCKTAHICVLLQCQYI